MRPIVVALPVLALALSACGVRADLNPLPGKSLPVAAYGRSEPPTAEKLLQVPTQAQPERNVELRARSETRADDPFDLPPAE